MNSPHHPLSSVLLCGLLLLITNAPAEAGSAIWNANPVDNDWSNPANWTPPIVPNGPTDIATFGVSSTTDISITASIEVNSIAFNPGASAYILRATTRSGLTFSHVGIINNSGVTQNFVTTAFAGDLNAGVITFSGKSSAGSGTVFTNHDGPSAVFDVGTTVFRDQSDAGGATFINLGGTTGGRSGGETNFYGGNGGHSTIIVNGAGVAGAFGGRVYVGSGSSLETASLTVSGHPGLAGGYVTFDSGSSGGTAAVSLFGTGNMDVSLAAFDPKMEVGSIEGDGRIGLGDSTLNVGSNNRPATFDGVIADGPFTEGFGGQLRKVGLEELTLTHSNAYTRSTVVTSGVLIVANETGSATGRGPVEVKAGRLSGTGTIAGAITVGTDSGVEAILDPGNGTTPGTLTIQNHLILRADATCVLLIDSNVPASDQVTARGITIRNASVLFQDVGTTPLPPTTTFTVINNIAATRIKGTFSNLPDDSTVTVGSNNFQANYEGGDGNDLTLTVVP